MMSPAAAQAQRPTLPNANTNAIANANAIAIAIANASPAHSSASSATQVGGHPDHTPGALLPLPLGPWPCSPDASLRDSYEAKCSTR